MKKTSPKAGKSKKATKKTAKADFSFIPAVGIYGAAEQFTKDGWEKTKP